MVLGGSDSGNGSLLAALDAAVDASAAAATMLTVDPFLGKTPTAGRSIGHTSVAFRVTFEGGGVAAYKPTSHRGGDRWRGEVAAYRMATALGLSNVPPAFAHSTAGAPLRAALDPTAGALYDAEVTPNDRGAINGALIPWIHDLEFPAVERDPLLSTWTNALHHDAPMPSGDDADLAAQMSSLVVFDLLDANWDRWSGGNVGKQKNSTTYLYIDNDGAFFAHPPQKTLDRAWARLAASDRFSKKLVTNLRTFDASILGPAPSLANANDGSELPDAIVAAVKQRQTRILATIDGKITQYGQDAVLVFP